MLDRLNYALIGCGEIACQTSDAITKSQRSRVVCCVDIRPDLAADLAAKHAARHTDKLHEALGDHEVHAVIISTPHYLHAPLAVQAAQAGKHVLVEKPIACDLGQVDAMIAAARKAGVKLGVMHVARLGFAVSKARQLIRQGALGQIVAVKLHHLANKPPSYWHGGYTGRARDDWRIYLKSSGGGFLIMNQIHNLDAMLSLLDSPPQRIYAEYATLRTPVEVEDFISFVMRLQSGAIVSLDGASAAVGAESFGDRIYGQNGQIALTPKGLRIYLAQPWQEIEAGRWIELPASPDWPNTRVACIDGFAKAVIENAVLPATGEDGRAALEIVRGAYLSMKRGAPISFPLADTQ